MTTNNIHVSTDKIITHRDGWGYRISDGDHGELVIYYFEDTAEGRKETEQMRLHVGEVGDALVDLLCEKYEEVKVRNG